MSCATEEDVKEYFKVEEQERLKQEQAAWSWDHMMNRMGDLERREAAGRGERRTRTRRNLRRRRLLH
ncbi:hypothetical protein PF010_g9769 [Phytophthora fragariae]|uniref:Uncharacterized protein n=1 Tax=Phytophthora fragariae TaxID=53985 RepID=A0A6A3UDI9_9STRA|nr:hypothetical protein PF003_g13727 [Phytophthora fragariae]KAE8939134.1 hypothetical protein PF009_g11019 [Phytophthora fragariae]KAE9006998.1 hypothetical protein PF011_g11315 [Phytophthora fragariae]KAE9110464.1 hypothetical protein PF007_g11844 [Phytophthora fragariae]KAE9114256.1 hypothetical protein PF010_g9769 [Phytophthora fragariae]